MSTGLSKIFCGIAAPCAILLCLSSISLGDAAHGQRKPKKAPPLPPLPSGPLGPVPQIPLDSIAPMAPQVTYQSGQLTIVAPNSTLGDILKAVHKQTGAEIEVPAANDRVVTHLGPGPAREVIADLLNGSRFNYVLLGSPEDSNALTRVVLVPKTGGEAANPGVQAAQNQEPPNGQPGNMVAQQQQMQEPPPDAADAEAAPDDTVDDAAADQPVEDQPAGAQQDQQGVKTPQQMLQEMQQRQLQIQQQQQQGQPGQMPPPGLRPPERNDPQQQQQ